MRTPDGRAAPFHATSASASFTVTGWARAAEMVGGSRFPTTPPRLLPRTGIHDTVADVEQWGWWSGQTSASQGLGGFVNEYGPCRPFTSAGPCGRGGSSSGTPAGRP
ncbi:phosphatase PAP2 family protein [Streptomyces sp. NBC_01455]|uniref:phosphatase PAP2 family protein n=1 Tax=Streptomyces sp. NBC_01455 TaxID=2903874 RepID=UPI003FCDA3C1